MISNYLLTALRNLTRHRLYSFINIAGLAVGLACVLFILLFLRDELNWDRAIPDTANLYRLSVTFVTPDRGPEFFPVVQLPLSTTMKNEIPEVVAETHYTPEPMTAAVGDRQFPTGVRSVDPNFLQTIKLPLVEGDAGTALSQPESVVLTETEARKFFGTADAMGKTVTLAGTHNLTVTGILRDIPDNSQLQFGEMLIPNTSSADAYPPGSQEWSKWTDVHGWAYVKLAPGADPAQVAAKIPALLDGHMDLRKEMNMPLRASQVAHIHLTPFTRVHLAAGGETRDGRWTTFYGFAAIAGLILLLACINYMNLATARAIMRAREVSIRKVLGARRGQLIVQFLGESLIVALVGLLLALALVELLLPAFDGLLMRQIAYQVFADWPLTLIMLAVAGMAGLAGGVYPALVLSGFRPAASLGGGTRTTGGSSLLRTALVVLQFAVSIGLGIAVIVIYAQIHYARTLDLGFNHHNVATIIGADDLTPATRDSITQALAAEPSIAVAAQSNTVPLSGLVELIDVVPTGSTQKFLPDYAVVDPNYFNVLGIRLVAGRNLSRERGNDVMHAADARNVYPDLNILINQAAAHEFGFTAANAMGRSVTLLSRYHATVVGVVSDVNYFGPQAAVRPMIYYQNPRVLGDISVRIRPGQTEAALAAMNRVWHRFVPTVAMRSFVEDARYDGLFHDDQREGQIFGIFVGIAIFIACLGLFGLASFTAARRNKEIAIRKTHGARTRDIVRLLVWQFSLPVLIANAIAWPVAWFYLHHWLEGYANRIALSPLYFIGAGVGALVIAWGTVIVQAAHAARANPIHALQYE